MIDDLPSVRTGAMTKALLRTGTAFATAFVLAASLSPAAYAQQDTAPAAGMAGTSQAPATAGTDAQGTPVSAGDIIVTGQRRSQRLQDVPASITAVTAEAINAAGFANPSDLQRVAPSLSFNPSVGSGFQIRGVGSQGVDYNLEKAVATVIDDVVQGIPRNIGLNTLADVERVEILRGPQGTLFGKNASGGVVFIVTQKPKLDTTEVIGRYRYGTDNEALVENTINVPLAKTLAARITGVFQQRDGSVRNLYDNSRANGYRDYAVKGKLLWQPTSDLEAYIIADYQNHHDSGIGFTNVYRQLGTYTGQANTLDIADVLASDGIRAGPKNEDISTQVHPFSRTETEGVQGNITWHLGDYTVTSITAYKHQDYFQTADLDATTRPVFDYNQTFMKADQFSQEVRLNSPLGGLVDYVVGAYFFNLNVRANERQGGLFFRTDLPANTLLSPVGGDAFYKATSRSAAAFGQANVHIFDKFTAILGGRYTHDHVFASFHTGPDPVHDLIPQTVLFPAKALSDSHDDFSGKITLQYEPSRELMFYATASQGYKAPAIATIRGNIRKVNPETVTNYEIGIKSQWFDRMLTLNVAAFTEKFKNFQTQTVTFFPDGTNAIVLANAGGLRSRGVEGDASLRLSRTFTLSGSMSYTPTKYTDFLTSCYPLQPLVPAPGPGCFVIPGAGNTAYQAAGKPLIYAPKWAYTIGGDYSVDVGDGKSATANLLYTWRSSTYSGAGDPNTIIPGYGLFNGNLSFGAADGRWRVGLYFRNLFDKFYVSRILRSGYTPLGTYQQTPAIDARRTVGGQISFHF